MFGNGAPWPWNNRPPVVVLADKRKAAMDEAVHEMLRDRGLKLEVHTREGNPFKLSDLRKVGCDYKFTSASSMHSMYGSLQTEVGVIAVRISCKPIRASSCLPPNLPSCAGVSF